MPSRKAKAKTRRKSGSTATRPNLQAGIGKKKLGRRPGVTVTRDGILDAAEIVFARGSYASTSLRAICEVAKVNPALIYHHFGSKEKLFKAIFERRGGQLKQERLMLIDRLESRKGDPPKLEEIVHAFLAPAFNLKRLGPGETAYLRLVARLPSEPAKISREISPALYDEPRQRYMDALRRVLPHLDGRALYWRMIFTIGAYFYTISDFHRLGARTDRYPEGRAFEDSFGQLKAFVVGGLLAPSSAGRGKGRA